MKYIISLICATIICSTGVSQNPFEEGYIYKKNGEQFNCLIKNSNWFKDFNFIEYKVANSNEIKNIEIGEVSEFKVGNICKFKWIKVLSSDSQNPEYSNLVENNIFAQIIVEGKATLYSKSIDGTKHFYYQNEGSIIQELIKKTYYIKDEKIVNNDYLKKINVDVKCKNSETQNELNFNERSLKDYFIKYNECVNSEIVFQKKPESLKTGLIVFAGINSSRFELEDHLNNNFIDDFVEYESKISPTIGIEGEIFLPVKNYSYSLIGGFTYGYFHSKAKEMEEFSDYEIKYNYLEINVGLRYYKLLNENSKLNFDLGALSDAFTKNSSSLEINPSAGIDDSFENSVNLYFAVGYNYNRFGARFKFFTNRNGIVNIKYLTSSFKNISFQLTYRIF